MEATRCVLKVTGNSLGCALEGKQAEIADLLKARAAGK